MSNNTISKMKKFLESNLNFSTTEKTDIITAMEKGIKKPLIFIRKISTWHKLYACPRCKKTFFITNNIGDYVNRCSNCGQKLDWKQFKKEEKEC